MEALKKQLISHFEGAGSAPFLFIGSGFSRRYLNLEDWSSLLRRFSDGIKPYEYYHATANGHLPMVASLIAEDFHDLWWADAKYEQSREKHKTKVRDKTSALRIEICNHINNIAGVGFTETAFPEEIVALSKLNVDGIITTNWDLFLEKLFPDYRVYIGQSELLFSHPQSIGEIYKIHGSASRPTSLVLTRQDYDLFESRNPYLAAKLITLFVEHPIVFIGYSLSDKNISALLKAIVSCLGAENIEKLRNNLIFVQRAHDQGGSYSKTLITIDGAQLPITIVKTDDFLPIYEALDATKRKIPARILRFCKEQLYELVQSTAPEAKMCVVDIDNIDKATDVEFVVGVGVAGGNTSEIGYQGLTAIDLFKDLILEEERKLDAEKILESTIPALSKNCKYLPVYKYLREIGINCRDVYKARNLSIDRHVEKTPAEYASTIYARQFVQTERHKTTQQIVDTNPPEKAAIFLSFVAKEKFDGIIVRQFLADNIEKLESSSSNYATYFRKAACLYDYYLHGWA
ncbi:SIR2 family protein [uncultured Mesotoga sp.]|uniref:SIR2 family protein n=1 Tax=uncultured Mesotoga sp. TaxID=1184400 RepID=UPI002599BCC9|nr:SIR2 family protein [uncultured Mesotoga sp.]